MLQAYIYDQTNSPYNVILGLDVLKPLGIDISCSTETLTWNNTRIPWKPKSYLDDASITDAQLAETSFCALPDFNIGYTEYDSFAAPAASAILQSKYSEVNINDIVQAQTHRTHHQQQGLASVLTNFQLLFSGKLGCYPGYKAHLELLQNAQPVHC